MHQITLEKGWSCELPTQYAIYQSLSDFSRYSVLDQEEESVCSFRITNDTCKITAFRPWQHQIELDAASKLIRLILIEETD
ncbi:MULTISPECIES: hypothetical protein [Exiguobacterium]|uniref:hypothetical protein n=1 Tax=Exiguobacterium TaxID=33986 RepID=UPI000496D427|nr:MULTISPECIES: hypothetical protein [Exiguobacterium]KGI85957.1 hypothetical protein JY98_06840 [Exiguobacterium mexicanum]TCI68673.1 hypothetical protein EVJ19_11010 [Exiguobacterium sp. IPCI3]TCI78183.1 hypothetical protein EVJ18_10495 [Exiguobacterium sp. IPCH1]TCI79325.1 hypothetical protein EVJ17_10495 [Exiguobacterium sp. IPBC4]